MYGHFFKIKISSIGLIETGNNHKISNSIVKAKLNKKCI